jgi:trimeric autotransporter adhesin
LIGNLFRYLIRNPEATDPEGALMKATFAALLFAGAAVVAPAAPAGAAPGTQAAGQAISISNFTYTPSPVSVAQGTVVTWTNMDGFGHSVTSDTSDTTDPFDSSPTNCSPTVSTGCIAPTGGTFTHTFAVLGTFTYHCRVHSFMAGSITVAAPPVTVTAVTPNKLGDGAIKKVTFTGTGFTSGATVTFSGSGVTAGSTTFVSSTSLTATVKVASAAATGARDVTVTDPAGGGSGTCTGCLTIDPPPVPTSVSPNSLARGATNVKVVLTGTGLVSGAKAKFSGTGVTVTSRTFVSSTELKLTVTVASTAATGGRKVKVVNPDGGVGSKGNVLTIT